MKTSEMRPHRRYLTYLLVLALSLSISLAISGCSSTESTTEVNAQGQGTTDGEQATHSNEQAEQAANVNQSTLSETDAIISLEGYGAIGALADKDLTILDMLSYAVQDEYLAHGEYLVILEKFGSQNPYSNIAQSEETHLALLKDLYSNYGLTFPDDSSAEHIITPADLLEAAKTGVKAEVDNIAMYDIFLTYDLPDDVKEVFISLKNASESHLNAFQRQVEKLS